MKILLLLAFIGLAAIVLAAFRAIAIANGSPRNKLDEWLPEIIGCSCFGTFAVAIAIMANVISK